MVLSCTVVDGTEVLAQTVLNEAGCSAPVLAQRFEGLGAAHIPNAY